MGMGDFNTRVGQLKGLENNTPDTNRNSPMFFTFLKETNLLIINTLPVVQGLGSWTPVVAQAQNLCWILA